MTCFRERRLARKRGLQFHVLHANSVRDFDTVFATLAQLRAGGLVIGSDPFFNSQSEQLAALAIRHGVPAIYQYREFAAAGGHACKLKLEGIVSKLRRSTYRSGRSPHWIKMKNPDCDAVRRETEEDWGEQGQ